MKRVRIGVSGISGRGVFAEEAIRIGEPILLMSGARVSDSEIDERYEEGNVRWDDPFEIGAGEYILLDETPVSINHSCRPNAGIRGVNELFALRLIPKGEEIFYDYSTVVGENAPDESDWLMTCTCGASECRGIIGNWRTLPSERLEVYKAAGALPDFVLTQLLGGK